MSDSKCAVHSPQHLSKAVQHSMQVVLYLYCTVQVSDACTSMRSVSYATCTVAYGE